MALPHQQGSVGQSVPSGRTASARADAVSRPVWETPGPCPTLRKPWKCSAPGLRRSLPEGALGEKLESAAVVGRPLRVKLGIDPSGSDLTLGHAVVLRKLRQFQDLGHLAVLIVGDFTGMVGDPSGRSAPRVLSAASRPRLIPATYFEQVMRVLDPDRVEVRRNSEWLAALTMADVVREAAHLTVAQLLERDDFARRFAARQPISLVEFLYPLLQGYDSVAVAADVELGGTDQTYNLLVGRELQRAHGQPPQVVLTVPLLEGLDGVEKMSKSLGNYVAINEPPEEQFGKLMSIPDELIERYARLCTALPPDEVAALAAAAEDGGPAAVGRQAPGRRRDRHALPRKPRRPSRSGALRPSVPGARAPAGRPGAPAAGNRPGAPAGCPGGQRPRRLPQ